MTSTSTQTRGLAEDRDRKISTTVYRPRTSSVAAFFDAPKAPAPTALNNNPTFKPQNITPNRPTNIVQSTKQPKAVNRDRKQSIWEQLNEPTTKTRTRDPAKEIEQVLEREIKYLSEEVTHFGDLFKQVQQEFKSGSEKKTSKRVMNLNQTELMIIQALSTWIITHGNPALKELEVFRRDVQDEITEMVHKMEEMSGENDSLKFQNKGLKQDNEQLTLELERLESDIARFRQEKEHQKRLSPDLLGNAVIIGGLQETLQSSEQQREDMEEEYKKLKKEYEFVFIDLESAKKRIESQNEYISALEAKLETMDINLVHIQKKHQEATQLIAEEQEKYTREIELQNMQLQIEIERVAKMNEVPKEAVKEEDVPITRYTVYGEEGGKVVENLDQSILFGEDNGIENLEEGYEFSDDAWMSESREHTPPPVEFETETLSITVEPEIRASFKNVKMTMEKEEDKPKASFQLTMSVTDNAHQVHVRMSPEFSSSKMVIENEAEPLALNAQFETHKESHEQENTLVPEKKPVEFSYERLSLGQEPLPKKPIVLKSSLDPIELTADDLLRTGTRFAMLLEKFKEKEFEKMGGSQQNRKISQSIITRLTEQAMQYQQTTPETASPFRHSSVSQKKFRTLQPRWTGYLSIIKSTTIPDAILQKHQQFYFCLDGLPRGTNNKTNESDDVKNRNGQPLIPSLFFFETEGDFKALMKESGNLPTRHLSFQKTFAKYCRGVFQLDTYAVDKDQIKCLEKLKKLVPRKKSLTPPILKRELDKTEQLIFCIGLQEHTVFKAADQYNRDKWLEKIDYLVEKRVRPLARHKITTVEEDMD